MYPVKQSTALTVPVFAHDENGDAVTGLTNGNFTKRISKNGGAFAAMTVTITEMENGWYSVPLSTSHTDTLGVLSITLTSTAKQINLQFRVEANLLDDLATQSSLNSKVPQNLNLTASGNIGIDWANVENPTTAVDLSATDIQLVDTCTTNTDMRGTDSALLASSAPTNFGDLSITATTGRVDVASIEGSDATDQINAACDASIETYHLDHLLAVDYDPASKPGTATALLNELVESNAGVSRFTSAALDQAWSVGTRVLTANTNLNDPTAATIAGAVWDESQTSHVTAGSFGEIATEIASILADTGELQSDDVPGLIAALNDVSTSEVLTQVNSALDTAISELSQGQPSATPSLRNAVMLLYMALRNKTVAQTTGTDELQIHNDAGTVIAKKTITDDGSDYTEAKMVSG